MKTMQLSEARKAFTRLPDELDEEQEALTITRRGKPVLAVLPYAAYEEMVETLETMTALSEGVRQVEAGERLEDMLDWESALKGLI